MRSSAIQNGGRNPNDGRQERQFRSSSNHSQSSYSTNGLRNKYLDSTKVAVRDQPSNTASRGSSQNNAVARAKGALLQEAIAAEEYGSIISLRPSFGFIQNIHSDEQVYFSEQDIYAGVKVGDHVSFLAHQSSKGLAASKIKLLDSSAALEPQATKVLGTILRIPERHRSNCGLIEVELSSLPTEKHSLLRRKPVNTIAYRPLDLDVASLPRNVLLDRGDFVEFTLSKIDGSGLLLASEIRLKQQRREREKEKAIAQQIQRMLDSGAVREIGIVTAVKNKEYGFIKAQDRKDELYFRMDGFLGDEETVIREGTEVEFFVVAEMVRGRISDRAMHLRVIPQGSVQFEAVVARDTLVTVVSEPGTQGEETPGVGVLSEPILVENITKKAKDVINDVEVWQRCLPDEMVCKRGDVLKVNVHYYRPEKLFFIRAVRLMEPFLLGRDKGTICSLKESAGFGFITSETRKLDLYFRINQVVAAMGEMMKRADVVEGLRVSFDVIVEGGKLRATRVKVLSTNESSDSDAAPLRIPIKSNVFGKVVRSTTANKDSVGLIQINPNVWREIQEFEYVDPDLKKSLSSFMSKMFLQEITIPSISSSMRRQLCGLIDKEYLDLVYEIVDGDTVEGVLQKNLRINKLYGGKRTTPPNQPGVKNGKKVVPKDGYTLSYTRDDYLSEQQLGPLGNDLEVFFDIVWDVTKGKCVAHSVRLTDESVDGVDGEQVGVVEVLIEKNDKFGFIRCVPACEKLFWHMSGVVASNMSLLKQGSFVAFSLRRRGGMRVAAQIRVLTDASDPLYKKVSEKEIVHSTVSNPILAVVVEQEKAILLDVSQIENLKDKMLPLSKLATLLVEADAQSKTWEKGGKTTNIPSKETATSPSTTAVANGDVAVTPTATESSGPASESGTISIEQHRVEYAAKYFAHFDREPVIITNSIINSTTVDSDEASATSATESATDDSTPALYKIGDIVEVNLSINWSLAQPISSVTVVKVVSQVLGGTVKRRGTLTKTKHRFKGLPHLSDFYNLNNVDFVEITELEEIPISEKDSALAAAAPPPNASTTGNVVPTKQKINYYFSVQGEIRSQSAQPLNNAADSVAIGDDVEFCVVSAFPNIALSVRAIPRVAKAELNFQSNRPGINDKLKEMKSKVGTTNVASMAAGPPSDTAKGFEPGWRKMDQDKIASLPWANSLLSHLLTNIPAATPVTGASTIATTDEPVDNSTST